MTSPPSRQTSPRKSQAAPARATKPGAPPAGMEPAARTAIEPGRRHAMIAEAAYFLAQRRGFNPGYEVEDWLTAEREVDHELTGQLGVPPAMSSKAQASFEHKLRARAQTLRSEIHETLLRTGNEQYVSIAGEVRDAEEDSVADLLVDVNLAEMTRDVEELRDTEAALLRMGTGTYGVCVTCGEPIALQRLEAYPTAKRCLACQRRYDQARQAAPPPSL